MMTALLENFISFYHQAYCAGMEFSSQYPSPACKPVDTGHRAGDVYQVYKTGPM